MLAAGDVERALLKLRARLASDGDDLETLALMLEASRDVVVGEKAKWTLHAENAQREFDATGDLREKTAIRVGRIFLYRRETAAARALGVWLQRRYPESPAAAPFLFDLYRTIGEPAAAFAALVRASEVHPQDPTINLLIAERLIGTGRAVEALPYAARLEGHDVSGRAFLALARARIASGEPASAPRLALQALDAGGAKPADLVAVVRDLTRTGAVELAHGLIDHLLAVAPTEAGYLLASVEVLDTTGRGGEAITALQQLADMYPQRANLEALFDRLVGAHRFVEAANVAVRLEAVLPRSLAAAVMRSRISAVEGATERSRQLADRTSARIVRRGSAPVGPRGAVIAGVIGSHGLGDFIYQLLALASLKRQFSEARLTLFYNNELSYKADILRFCPDLDEVRDYAGGAINLPVATKNWDNFRQTILFTQSSLSPTLLSGLDRTATFVTPPEEVEGYTAALNERGLRPDGWFVAIHYRQNSLFGVGGGASRDVDAEPFHRLAKWIVAQGGQVVRLGHPGMPPLPRQVGYIDLADGGLPLQLFAVSKARFMVGCDSGPSGYATAFKTPLFKTNTFSEDGAAYSGDLILPKNLVTAWGDVLSIGDALEDRLVFFKNLIDEGGGLRFLDNSFEQLCHGTQIMLDQNPLDGWRGPPPPDLAPPADAIPWPRTNARKARILDVSHLLGFPVRRISRDDILKVSL